MKKHRLRIYPSQDNDPKPHIFVELTKDSWVESSTIPNHEGIHESIKDFEKDKIFPITLNTRYFHYALFLKDLDYKEEYIE